MSKIINGGLYRVDFMSSTSAEFNGTHPTLVIRTLKENSLYIVIPFTSYTDERWAKIKRDGYGMRVHSTNSIARIDKFQVINTSKIKKRWRENGYILNITPYELNLISNKLDHYLQVSSQNAFNEFERHVIEYNTIHEELKLVNDYKPSAIFSVSQTTDKFFLTSSKSNFNNITFEDIIDLVKIVFNVKNVSIDKNASPVDLIISYKK